jgi:membrane associated rhomboid family serine protease
MVLPLWEHHPGRRTVPWVNYTLIALNVAVFVFLQRLGTNGEFTNAFALVPAEVAAGRDITTEDQVVRDPASGQKYRVLGLQPMPLPLPDPWSAWVTLLTSLFMHGRLLHLAGNMLFLWVFGNSLEDFLGHDRYFLFYLLCGVLASLAQVAGTYAFDGDPLVPSLGASGAISAVLAGYFVLFPFRRVTVGVGPVLLPLPAWVAVGIWFALQLLGGLAALRGEAPAAGVAFGAHIGGFLAGLVLIKLFALGKEESSGPAPALP